MAGHDGDWLEMSGVDRLRQARDRLTPTHPEGNPEPSAPGGPPTAAGEPAPQPVNLAAPEHREKLAALFGWAAEGRSWEEIRDEAVRLVLPSHQPDKEGAGPAEEPARAVDQPPAAPPGRPSGPGAPG